MATSGWQLAGDAPTAYTRFALKILEPWTDDLICTAKCRDGDRVLDVACGTGLVAGRVQLVSGKLCAVTGIDINEAMLSVARRNSLIEWHHGNAAELPFEDGSFDVVLCQQGLQYFADRMGAMREMTRVLAPGGRIALSVWGSLERQPFYVALVNGIVEFLGDAARSSFDLAFSLNTAEGLRQLARDVGLTSVHVRFEHRTTRYNPAAGLIAGFMGATPVAAQFFALPSVEQGALVTYVAESLAGYMDDDGLAFPQENHFLTGRK